MEWWELFFPKKCINCGRWGSYVCEGCEVGLWEEQQICPVCRRASRYGLRHSYCRRAYSLDGLICLWAYEGIARKLITQAKYKFFYDYLREFSITNFSVRAGSGSAGQFSNRPELSYFLKFLETRPVVVPVPLHPKRERERGFNQADLIARSFAARHKLSCDSHLLQRSKDTGHQTLRNREERLKAVEGAFALAPRTYNLAPSMLLVDDVWTTGATLSECCRVLKKAGVKKVWGLVLAR